ncbi:uncharacterized protein EI90DRAFT_3149869 [Cantharellus anzutake]|uniref:uncharacterized protein n=1 Tax=Cantharellus anzutake TaxID=1750568 RepID=UPI00190405D3|nr:uncharacterized protein EI90DRAFT_3149869 [Cantharellus anzutake]KAF8342794.1 hypothetical protein EI90DRAFT_3149869 [Cantharellus anzutake]
MFKGKLAYRSWSELPAEVLKLVATEIINDFFLVNPYVPRTWDQPHKYHARTLWLMLSAAEELQALQSVCRRWESALFSHRFWTQIVEMLDRTRQHTVFSDLERPSPFSIYQAIINTCCIPCFFNLSSLNPTPAKHQVQTAHLGWVSACALHHKERFCSVCLQDEYVPQTLRPWHDVDHQGRWKPPGLCLNDDVQTWAQCLMTCLTCRREELDKKLTRTFGPNIGQLATDSIIPVIYSDFVRSGRGDIKRVTADIDDRLWLQENTRYDEHMEQYRSSVLLNRIGAEEFELLQRMRAEQHERMAQGYHVEPLPDNLSIHEVYTYKARESLRNMALHEWAKCRVMEGYWFAPADFWQDGYSAAVENLESAAHRGVAVVHPHEGFQINPEGLRYPSNVHFGSTPPRGSLLSDCQFAFLRIFRLILRPALENCLRRLIAMSKASGVDPCTVAQKIKTEQLLSCEYLRAPENWLAGYDWQAQYTSTSPTEEASPSLTASTTTASEGSGSGRGGSDGTDGRSSPATTFRTTPSPSPEVKPQSLESNPLPAESMSPSLPTCQTVVPSQTSSSTPGEWSSSSPTRLLVAEPRPFEHVPRIPVYWTYLGPSIPQLLESLWQEVYTPLFTCSCSICKRGVTSVDTEDEYTRDEPLLQQLMESGGDITQQFLRQYKTHEIDDEELYDYDDEEEEFEEEAENWADYVVHAQGWTEVSSRPSPEAENISPPSLDPDNAEDGQSESALEFEDTSGSASPGKDPLGSKAGSTVGSRRSRDLDDVDGPAAGVVASEGGIGHGRKRLKS